ncbi:hypothetical protein SIO70_15860 [Chitinophaga sancti]|uniref:hypothetical protein n=1 Tax=Chitinophaga sancti TaxID=1004 RepID=UPI002A759EB0|nr:hypothetical protein [Chitinophaga sancti]WPQ66334.1 hypothetical protein SIO70_15860 [Chitinophaga sancti]
MNTEKSSYIKADESLSPQKEIALADPQKCPFFIKQFEKAKEFMKNNPVPVELLKVK